MKKIWLIIIITAMGVVGYFVFGIDQTDHSTHVMCESNECSVSIGESVMINDVMWERGEGINRYRNKQGVFNNVGRNSPQEIRDDLRIDEVNWDENLTKKIQFIEK